MKYRTFKQLVLTIGVGLTCTFINAAPGPIKGQTHALVTQGGYAYIGVGNQLKAVDVISSTEPVVAGETPAFRDIVQSLEVVDNRVYVAAGAAGLLIVDVSDPTKPKTVSVYDTPGNAQGIHVSGKRAYLADGAAGLHVIDISNPSEPALLGTSTTEGWDWDVSVDNEVVYVAAGEEGIRIIDVVDPTKPKQIGSFQTPNDATDVVVQGGFVYVAAASSGLRILSIANRTHPVEVGFVNSEYARNVHLKDGFAFISCERRGVLVVDVSDPTRPRPGRKLPANGSANMVQTAGDDIFVADGVGGLQIHTLAQSKSQLRTLAPPNSKFLMLVPSRSKQRERFQLPIDQDSSAIP